MAGGVGEKYKSFIGCGTGDTASDKIRDLLIYFFSRVAVSVSFSELVAVMCRPPPLPPHPVQ